MNITHFRNINSKLHENISASYFMYVERNNGLKIRTPGCWSRLLSWLSFWWTQLLSCEIGMVVGTA